MPAATVQLRFLQRRALTSAGAEAIEPVLQQFYAAEPTDPIDFLGEWRDVEIVTDVAPQGGPL